MTRQMRELTIRITRCSRASWFRLDIAGCILHLDPGYAGYFENQGIPMEALSEKADIVLISHDHKEHLQPVALDLICDFRTIIFAPRRAAAKIARPGVTVVEVGDVWTVGPLRMTAVMACNVPESHSTRKVHHPGDGVGYLIQSPDWFVYFAGDTDRIPEMKELGSPDLAMLPIGGTFVMDPEEAAQALEWIRPRWVIPMHESKEDPAIFEQIVRSRSDVAVLRLKPGETVEV